MDINGREVLREVIIGVLGALLSVLTKSK